MSIQTTNPATNKISHFDEMTDKESQYYLQNPILLLKNGKKLVLPIEQI
jgi:hypothetical protein